jgi:glucose/arabinose dehydrogenase
VQNRGHRGSADEAVSCSEDNIVGAERRIRDVAEMPDGSLLLLTDGDNAELLRLSPAAPARKKIDEG